MILLRYNLDVWARYISIVPSLSENLNEMYVCLNKMDQQTQICDFINRAKKTRKLSRGNVFLTADEKCELRPGNLINFNGELRCVIYILFFNNFPSNNICESKTQWKHVAAITRESTLPRL